MLTAEEITKQIADAKKEVDRLEDNRAKALGNSINFIENELELQRTLAKIEAFEIVLNK